MKRKGSFHPKLLIGLVIALLACGGGVVSCVSSVVDSVRDFSDSSPAPAPDLQTEEGWSEMIASFASETDLAETVSVAVRRGSATLAVESDDSTGAGYYFDGDVTTTDDVALDGNQEVFDLGDIDPSVVVEAVAQARRSSGEPESTEALVQVGSANGAPQILVEFLAGASDTYALVVDDDGTVVSETR